MTPTAIDSLHR